MEWLRKKNYLIFDDFLESLFLSKPSLHLYTDSYEFWEGDTPKDLERPSTVLLTCPDLFDTLHLKILLETVNHNEDTNQDAVFPLVDPPGLD